MKHPQIILVTGASSGFGRVIATRLAAQGHIVYGSSRKALSDNPGFKMLQLDITDPAIFASPYYYLKQNDVVYIEPNAAKQRNSRYSQSKQYNITVFTSILSTISVITTVVLAIKK